MNKKDKRSPGYFKVGSKVWSVVNDFTGYHLVCGEVVEEIPWEDRKEEVASIRIRDTNTGLSQNWYPTLVHKAKMAAITAMLYSASNELAGLEERVSTVKKSIAQYVPKRKGGKKDA